MSISNVQIDKVFKDYHKFKGALPSDKLLTYLPLGLEIGECVIINFDTSDEPGSHWVCAIQQPSQRSSEKALIYIDPYGLPPPMRIYEWLAHSKGGFRYNNTDYQPLTSDECGMYCTYFCFNFLRGKPWSGELYDLIHTGDKSEKSKINDKIVKHLWNRLYYDNFMKESRPVEAQTKVEKGSGADEVYDGLRHSAEIIDKIAPGFDSFTKLVKYGFNPINQYQSPPPGLGRTAKHFQKPMSSGVYLPVGNSHTANDLVKDDVITHEDVNPLSSSNPTPSDQSAVVTDEPRDVNIVRPDMDANYKKWGFDSLNLLSAIPVVGDALGGVASAANLIAGNGFKGKIDKRLDRPYFYYLDGSKSDKLTVEDKEKLYNELFEKSAELTAKIIDTIQSLPKSRKAESEIYTKAFHKAAKLTHEILKEYIPGYSQHVPGSTGLNHSLKIIFEGSAFLDKSRVFLDKSRDFLVKSRDPLRRFNIEGKGFGGIDIYKDWPTPNPGEDSEAYAKRFGMDPKKAWDFYDAHDVDIANLNLNYYKVRPPYPWEGSFPYWIDNEYKGAHTMPKSAADLIYAVRIKNQYREGVAEQNAPIEAENERLKEHPEIAKNTADAFRKGVVQTAENGVIRDVLKVAGPAAQILGALVPGAGEVFDAISSGVDVANELVPTEEQDKENATENVIKAAHPEIGTGIIESANEIDGQGIQSILFKRPEWTPDKAIRWLKNHRHFYYKIDIKPEHLRFRQYDPVPGKKYFTKNIKDEKSGIQFIIDY